MRGQTAIFGVFILLLAAETPAVTERMIYESISPTMTYWGRLFLAGHLLLDPVLGIAWRVANADLREWCASLLSG